MRTSVSCSDLAPLMLLVGHALPLPKAGRALLASGCESFACVDSAEAACIVLAAGQRRAVVIVDSALAGGVCGHELRQACHCETIPIIALLPASKNFEMELKAELVHIFGGQTFSEAA